MKFSTRELVTLGVFGALWGAVELSFGSILHVMKVPMAGVILTAIGLAIAMIGRLFVCRPGATLFIGLIAALLKLFSLGGVVIWPLLGIVIEALLAEVVLSALRKPSQGAFTMAGAVGVLWTFVHPFVMHGLIMGSGILTVWLRTLDQGSQVLGIDPSAVLWLILALIGLRLGIGAAAGLLAWSVGRSVYARLGRPER